MTGRDRMTEVGKRARAQKLRRGQLLAALLLLSGVILSSLVPGGPIENRDFSELPPALLLTFNVLLTALGLGSFVLLPAVWRGVSWAARASAGFGAGYVLVYGVDLLGWFPPTASPMSPSLLSLEIAGTLLGLSMLALAPGGTQAPASAAGKSLDPLLLFALIMIAVTIIAFATWSAMQPQI
jgi:hypothetical protein